MQVDTVGLLASSIRTERVVELARSFCAIPSRLGDEGALGQLVAATLDRPGIDVHYEEVVQGRPNVIATIKGAGHRPPLVLNGHLDAAVHPGAWAGDPFDPWVEDGRVYGGGITDMKGAVAAMVATMEAAAEVDSLPGDLVLQAVMHHDGTGLGTKYALASEGPRAGFAICGEPSSLAIHTANGGAVKFEIAFTGRAAHICRVEEGIDTIPPAAEVCRLLRSHAFAHEPSPRLPDLPRVLVGQLVAGTAPAHVADRAVVRGDVRTVPGMDRTSVRDELQILAEAATPGGVQARVRILSAHQPFFGATGGPLVDAIRVAHATVRDEEPRITNELPGQAFVTDAADLVAAGLETVVYGPGDWRHAPDESIAVEDLADAARVYLTTAVLLTGKENS